VPFPFGFSAGPHRLADRHGDVSAGQDGHHGPGPQRRIRVDLAGEKPDQHGRGVADGDPDPEPDPQAATSKPTTAARATPLSGPGRCDAQLGCISRGLILVAREVNADPRRLQTR
jgi:hypothetical protein